MMHSGTLRRGMCWPAAVLMFDGLGNVVLPSNMRQANLKPAAEFSQSPEMPPSA